jgi:hypothetical protein
VSTCGRVRRVRDDGIGITLWGQTEHVVSETQAVELAMNILAARVGAAMSPEAIAAFVASLPDEWAPPPIDARVTVYGSAGPYRPTNPEDQGDGA